MSTLKKIDNKVSIREISWIEKKKGTNHYYEKSTAAKGFIESTNFKIGLLIKNDEQKR